MSEITPTMYRLKGKLRCLLACLFFTTTTQNFAQQYLYFIDKAMEFSGSGWKYDKVMAEIFIFFKTSVGAITPMMYGDG